MTSSVGGVSAANTPSPKRGRYAESSLAVAISSICIAEQASSAAGDLLHQAIFLEIGRGENVRVGVCGRAHDYRHTLQRAAGDLAARALHAGAVGRGHVERLAL